MIKVPDESVIPIMAKDVDFAKTALKFFAEIISPFYKECCDVAGVEDHPVIGIAG
jgi:hypothetical protein